MQRPGSPSPSPSGISQPARRSGPPARRASATAAPARHPHDGWGRGNVTGRASARPPRTPRPPSAPTPVVAAALGSRRSSPSRRERLSRPSPRGVADMGDPAVRGGARPRRYLTVSGGMDGVHDVEGGLLPETGIPWEAARGIPLASRMARAASASPWSTVGRSHGRAATASERPLRTAPSPPRGCSRPVPSPSRWPALRLVDEGRLGLDLPGRRRGGHGSAAPAGRQRAARGAAAVRGRPAPTVGVRYGHVCRRRRGRPKRPEGKEDAEAPA